MTHTEILEKAIKKAIDGGWDAFGFRHGYWQYSTGTGSDMIGISTFSNNTALSAFWSGHSNDLIFNKDFARALWPWNESLKCPYCGISFPGSLMHPNPCPLANRFYPGLWQYHLQLMVIADDPIQYLNDNM